MSGGGRGGGRDGSQGGQAATQTAHLHRLIINNKDYNVNSKTALRQYKRLYSKPHYWTVAYLFQDGLDDTWPSLFVTTTETDDLDILRLEQQEAHGVHILETQMLNKNRCKQPSL